jgi:hypothetical protein
MGGADEIGDRHAERYIDLDDPDIAMEKLEVNTPPTPTPHEMTILFLQLVLLQVIEDKAVALNLFHDAEDDCLRAVEYCRRENSPGFDSLELAPAPRCFANQVLSELRRRIGGSPTSLTDGTLRLRHHAREITLAAVVPDSSEVRVYFTDDRPPIRTKGKR